MIRSERAGCETGKKDRNRRVATGLILLLVLLTIFTGCGKKADQQSGGTEPTAKVETTQAAAGDSETTGAVGDSETAGAAADPEHAGPAGSSSIKRDGRYDSKEDVAEYIVAFGRLPENYITKKEARALGWSGGSVERYAPGMCIGGDRFGNYEGNLPGGKYTECDIGTMGKDSRGAKRLVFSDDEIYYTDDHYKTFEKVCDR